MSFSLDARTFDPKALSPAQRAFNAKLSSVTAADPKWYDIGAAEYRRRAAAGAGSVLPAPVLLPSAIPFEVPSREEGRMIPCRVFKPQTGRAPRAVYMYIHGGGWVLGDVSGYDPRLQSLADKHGIVCVSVGYRLAPENPFPAGPQDCFDVAEWLVGNAEETLEAPLAFIGGSSAGAHLTMVTSLHLLQHSDVKYSRFRLRGLLLEFGCFSFRFTPGVYNFARREPNLVLSVETLHAFREAALGKDWTEQMLDDPNISPLNADLASLNGKLPPALFLCGTEDYLLDDTLFMGSRWVAAGGEATLTIVTGAAHGFTEFDASIEGSGAAKGQQATDCFLKAKMLDTPK